MDTISISLITITAINTILGIALFLGNRKNENGSVYALNVLTIISWAVSMFFYRIAVQDSILVTVKLLYVSATLIGSTFFYFTYYFPEREKKKISDLLLTFIPNLVIIYLITFTDFIIKSASVMVGEENHIVFGRYYILYVLYILFYFLYSFFRLYRKYKKSEDQLQRRQIVYLLIGYMSSANLAFVTNLLLPWFGYFALNWFGQLSTILMVTSASFAIFRYKLFDTKFILTELLVFSFWTVQFIRTLSSDSSHDQFINAIVLVVTVVLGILLIRSVIKEVENREKIQLLADDLAKANDRLKELDQLKSEFLSIASHQIRAPITAIKGYASLILEDTYGKVSNEVRNAVQIIFQSSQSMAIMVDDFLNISRIEQGKMKFDFVEADFADIVRQSVNELIQTAKKKGLELIVGFEPSLKCSTRIDVGKIKQAVTNIIDNSIKYTPKGHIRVDLSTDEDRRVYRLAVSDTGVGIPAHTIPHLFEKFSRAQNAITTNISGTGLGLYVVRQMILAHKGKVWAESAGEGKGSTFFIEVPF